MTSLPDRSDPDYLRQHARRAGPHRNGAPASHSPIAPTDDEIKELQNASYILRITFRAGAPSININAIRAYSLTREGGQKSLDEPDIFLRRRHQVGLWQRMVLGCALKQLHSDNTGVPHQVGHFATLKDLRSFAAIQREQFHQRLGKILTACAKELGNRSASQRYSEARHLADWVLNEYELKNILRLKGTSGSERWLFWLNGRVKVHSNLETFLANTPSLWPEHLSTAQEVYEVWEALSKRRRKSPLTAIGTTSHTGSPRGPEGGDRLINSWPAKTPTELLPSQADRVTCLLRFYKKALEATGGFAPYEYELGDSAKPLRVATPVFTSPGWLRPQVLHPSKGPLRTYRYRDNVPEPSHKYKQDDVVFRLDAISIKQGDYHPTFSPMRYHEYDRSYARLEDELLEVLSKKPRGPLSLRQKLLPPRVFARLATGSTDAFGRIMCIGGVNTVLAMRMPDRKGYAIPLQIRKDVRDGRHQLAPIPKGFHSAITLDLREESHLHWTVIRELLEEVHGKDKVRQAIKGCPGPEFMLDYPEAQIFKRPSSFRLEIVGFGVGAVLGSYEFAALLVINDPSWYVDWCSRKGDIDLGPETAELWTVHTDRENEIRDVLHHPNWTGEGAYTFVQALRRLQRLAKPRVGLPKIRCRVGRAVV